jgi:hypothetical protein
MRNNRPVVVVASDPVCRPGVTDPNADSYATMRRLVSALLGVAIVACSSTATPLPLNDGNIALGTWGGDTAAMIVGDTAMHLHIGCTFGDVSGRVPLDAQNRFDVSGSYMLRAFPIAVGPSVPARFTGRLDGNVISITATIDDTVQMKTVVLGPVKVAYLVDPKR